MMALMPLRTQIMRVIASQNCFSKLQRSMAYKSAISLETLYPNSSLKLTTAAFIPNPNEKFSGYIPLNKLDIKYSASSGPGGQNVNKVHTKVDLRFKVSEADWIPSEIRDKLLELYSNKFTKDGYFIIRSDVTRSQQLNLADCLQKLRNIIRDAAITKREASPETEERIRQRQVHNLIISSNTSLLQQRIATQPRIILISEESIKQLQQLQKFKISETMRTLGFPQQISLESFRNPNWMLVEACMRWLAARVEPDVVLAGGIQTMDQRVAMVSHATELFHSRANLKLNGKKLYGADGWAVRELLKVAVMLRSSLEMPQHDDQMADSNSLLYDISNRVGEIKQARTLATDITAQGAYLYDLLAKEPENKDHRNRALSRQLDLASLSGALSRAVQSVSARAAAVREQSDTVAAAEAALDAKLERRRAELQRAENRLLTVQKIKPAYQSELTALEEEVSLLWERYVLRYRCVEALKHRLSVLESAQAEAAEEQQAAIMQLILKYEAEDVLGKLSESDDLYTSDEGQESKAPRPATRPKTRLRIKTAGGGSSRSSWGALPAHTHAQQSSSDTDLSDTQPYGDGGGWRPRPATRTLAAAGDYDDLLQGEEGEEAVSVGSAGSGPSLDSELPPSERPGRTSALSDNEF